MAQGDARDFPEVPDRPSPVTLYPWLLIAVAAARDTVDGKFHPASRPPGRCPRAGTGSTGCGNGSPPTAGR